MKLKIQILAITSLLFTTVFAQQDSSSSKYQSHEYFPKAGNVGTTILLTGLIDNIQLNSPKANLGQNMLFVRYYLEDDLVLRMGLGVGLRASLNEKADSVGQTLVTKDSIYGNFSLNISGGIEKHLQSSNRLDPYIFGQIDLTFIGKENITVDQETISKAGTEKVERTIKKDGGFGFGMVGGAGLNYFLGKRFSVGTELGLVFQYSTIGGTTSDNTVTTPINGSSTSEFITSDDKVNLAQMNVFTNALINISYFF